MYQRILISYDGTGPSEAALTQAATIARACKAELHMLGVVRTTGAFAMAQAGGPIDVYSKEREIIERVLKKAAKDPQLEGLDVKLSMREGDPVREIIAKVRQINADLAVLGHSDEGLLMRWLQGSTGSGLIAEMPCNVLIAKKS